MPEELRPQNKRKAHVKPNKAKRAKIVPTEVIEQKLKLLEQKEKENPEGEKAVKTGHESDDELEVGVQRCCAIYMIRELNHLRTTMSKWWIRKWTRT